MRDDRANGHADIKPEVKKSKSNVSVLWISRTTFSLFQFGVVTLLIILGIIHYVYAGIYGGDFITKLTEVFDVYGENSLSNAFAVFNLLISSMLSFVVYLHSKGHRESISVNWLILSIILLVLSIDDAAALHERSRGLGLFETWRVFAALCGFAMLLFFIPFLLKLDRRTATLLVLSGAIFATGVIFLPGTAELEYFGGWKAHNEVDFAHQALKILEEAFEMYGIALLNCTLFRHIMAERIIVALGGKPQSPAFGHILAKSIVTTLGGNPQNPVR